eukprot:TRINITY_DN22851_c0_g1_i4.p1 TRINITY_DN22851_c0_g1~~TRINITY_DN22851_c0_g1_i4.p1  ORF type:complete len:1116 (-),score=191.33 TRINITY_DN22851_c0_g1_i4:276-3524(-)
MASGLIYSGLASAYAYGSLAYNYNMGRFQFDAGQQQNKAHQHMNMNLAQWGLYREDVRGLFDMTTAQIGTYATIGTLAISFAVNYLFCCLELMPKSPGWLLFFWTNSVFASIIYGVLGVWLGMHCSNAAHLAEVKVLIEAVRPHVPTALELQSVMNTLKKFEASGPLAFLQVPAVLKPSFMKNHQGDGNSEPDLASISGDEEDGPMHRVSAVAQWEQNRLLQVLSKAKSGTGLSDSALTREHIELFRDIQFTYASFEGYARVAFLLAVHQLQMATAYMFMTQYMVRVENSLACAWLTVLVYTFFVHTLFRLDMFVGNIRLRIVKILITAGPFLIAAAVTIWVWNSEHIREHHVVLYSEFLPKTLAAAAAAVNVLAELWLLAEAVPNSSKAQLPGSFRPVRYIDVFGWWEHDDDEFAEASAGLIGTVNMTQQAVRAGAVGLIADSPHHISNQMAGPSSSSRAGARSHTRQLQSSIREARRLKRMIERVLEPRNAQHLLPEEFNGMEDLQAALQIATEECLEPLTEEDKSAMMRGKRSVSGGSMIAKRQTVKRVNGQLRDTDEDFQRQITAMSRLSSITGRDSSLRTPWIRLEMTTECGQVMPYYLNTNSSEVCWEEPDTTAIDLEAIRSAVQFMEKRLKLPEQKQGEEADTAVQKDPNEFDTVVVDLPSREEAKRQTSLQGFHNPVVETVARRPGSAYDPRTMPWRYFRKAVMCVVLLWLGTMLWILILGIFGARPALPVVDTVPTKWPHAFFRPSAVACDEGHLLVADQFAVHMADIQESISPNTTDDEPLGLQMMLRPKDRRNGRWRSISVDCASSLLKGGSCGAVYLLSQDGRTVTRYQPFWKSSEDWPVGPSKNLVLHALSHANTSMTSSRCGAGTWGVYGATDRGEVLLLCALRGQLMPVLRIAGVPPALKKVRTTSILKDHLGADEFTGLHIGNSGALWLLARIADGSQSELRVWKPDGKLLAEWRLPPGKQWASGMCMVRHGDERNLLLASSADETGPKATPDIWHFQLDDSDIGLVPYKRGVKGRMRDYGQRLFVTTVLFMLAMLGYVRRRRWVLSLAGSARRLGRLDGSRKAKQ